MKLALYTTIHPATLPYVADWYRSVESQTVTDFEIWIGIDAVDIDDAIKAMGGSPDINWVAAKTGDTPAQVRERAFEALIPHADAVVMTDADDMLHPDCFAAARRCISNHAYDVFGFSLRLIGEDGEVLGMKLPPKGYATPEVALPEYNIFGLGNTVYSTATLKNCLPLPRNGILVDWFLVTRAWLQGARLGYDSTARIDYRQHEQSTISLLPPYTVEGIRRATSAVQTHFRTVCAMRASEADPVRRNQLEQAAIRVEAFATHVTSTPQALFHYVEALNTLEPLPLWWSCVAHPELEYMWTATKDKNYNANS